MEDILSLITQSIPYLKMASSCYADANGIKGTDFLCLYRIDEITFEDKSPRREALENVISVMCHKGVNFIYIIKGDEKGVSFYYGAARDASIKNNIIDADLIGSKILRPTISGNFRGSKATRLDNKQKEKLLDDIDNMKYANILEGVPGISKDKESFQSVDRMIDVMLGSEFVFMLIAKPFDVKKLQILEGRANKFYDMIYPLSKSNIQSGTGKSSSKTDSETKGESETNGGSETKTHQEGNSHTEGSNSSDTHSKEKSTTKGTNTSNKSDSGTEGTSDSYSNGTSKSDTSNSSDSTAKATSSSKGTSSSTSVSTQTGENSSTTTSTESVNKCVSEWLRYMDDIILPRVDYGKGKGLFISSAVLFSNDIENIAKLESNIRSLYSGETGNRMPFHSFELALNEKKLFSRMQIPTVFFSEKAEFEERLLRTVYSQFVINSESAYLGNWMSARELSLFANLPTKEVVGLSLKEEVDFGLNPPKQIEDSLVLGHLVQNGTVLDGEDNKPDIEISFDKKYFDKHIFVTGVTGSGKTTTCQKLLIESNRNFMVIEPAKTEYRVLKEKFPDLLVFTIGNETVAPFRLNPFEFFPNESITSRVDMIKASMEAAFDMEAAIPQILETAMYEIYKAKGWNISSNKNTMFSDPFAPGVYAFPTLEDLDNKIEEVVNNQGFAERLKSDYIGSIRARLNGMRVGAKGMMLDTSRSIDFVSLLDRKVVFELENIRSGSEKSLIMGFILSNLSEAIKYAYSQRRCKINHITLVEEAHRLLSKYSPGDSMSKKQGVEMFSDMLAEVRKYGEALIIADQIPNKLTTDVLKNTNTKIVHRIFAQDDKEAIGNMMALKEEQKEYLSYLETGSAVMTYPELTKPVHIKVLQDRYNDTERLPPNDSSLRRDCMNYYAKSYKTGIIKGLEYMQSEPEIKDIELYNCYFGKDSAFLEMYSDAVKNQIISSEFVQSVQKLVLNFGKTVLSKIITAVAYKPENIIRHSNYYEYIEKFITAVLNKGEKMRFEDIKTINIYIQNIV